MSESAKRVFDVGISVSGGLLLSPLMAGVTLAVRVSDGAPVFFRQERVGRGGDVFVIHKFRTMTNEHDRFPVSATGDPRVTRLGTLLRKSKLDELPQLWNVVRGDMSLVGPRPELSEFVSMWSQQDRDVILSIRPGITDPTALLLRDEGELLSGVEDQRGYYVDVLLPRKCAAYRSYVEHRSFVGDIQVLVRTVAVLFGVNSRGDKRY
ncbi:MAG: sugar transferase [Ornithinimicrobium sp.]